MERRIFDLCWSLGLGSLLLRLDPLQATNHFLFVLSYLHFLLAGTTAGWNVERSLSLAILSEENYRRDRCLAGGLEFSARKWLWVAGICIGKSRRNDARRLVLIPVLTVCLQTEGKFCRFPDLWWVSCSWTCYIRKGIIVILTYEFLHDIGIRRSSIGDMEVLDSWNPPSSSTRCDCDVMSVWYDVVNLR